MQYQTSFSRRARHLLLLLAATTSAYAQFDLQDSHTTASLRGIYSIGEGVAWASGTDGTVLRTLDGGALWQPCTTPPGAEKLDFRGIQAFDRNTAIVMSSGKGDLSRLYKTTDGCATWKLLLTNPDKEGFWDAIAFSDPDHGFLLGDPVPIFTGKYKRFTLEQTFDGGKSWTVWQQGVSGLDADKDAGAFAASNSSLIAVDRFSAAFATGGAGGSTLNYTSTHGAGLCTCAPMPSEKDWNDQMEVLTTGPAPFPKAESAGIFSIAIAEHTVVAVGGDYKQPDLPAGTAAFVSRGGHDPLQPAITPPHGYRSSVAYDPTHKAWITVGPNGSDISTDDGRNWTALKPAPNQPPSADKDTDKNWNALSLPFVVGPHGRIGKLRSDALLPALLALPSPE